MCAMCSIIGYVQNKSEDSGTEALRETTRAQGPWRILGGLVGWHGGVGQTWRLVWGPREALDHRTVWGSGFGTLLETLLEVTVL